MGHFISDVFLLLLLPWRAQVDQWVHVTFKCAQRWCRNGQTPPRVRRRRRRRRFQRLCVPHIRAHSCSCCSATTRTGTHFLNESIIICDERIRWADCIVFGGFLHVSCQTLGFCQWKKRAVCSKRLDMKIYTHQTHNSRSNRNDVIITYPHSSAKHSWDIANTENANTENNHFHLLQVPPLRSFFFAVRVESKSPHRTFFATTRYWWGGHFERSGCPPPHCPTTTF